MEPQRWQQVKDEFERLIELSDAERAAELNQLRSADPDLATEVDSLLQCDDSGTFLEDSTRGLEALANEVSWIGTVIGPYRVLEEIGRGGMGQVYLAARTDDFQQRVAIKVVQAGGTAVERFLDERQILANLNHPNIARLLDGGTTEDGTPFLVLEHIEGQPIDEYCDSHRLSVEQRLQLLCTVCSAVHYAHSNLVVHRDIKPNNILVTEDGVAKLLDFGIAKLLNSDQTPMPGATMIGGAIPMTPEYASPEQYLRQSISTASDVYTLGVLAYRLLAGRTPFPATDHNMSQLAGIVCTQSAAELSAAVRDVDPDLLACRPETRARLQRELLGDLDGIVAKALAKDPLQRYPSAEALGRDLRRYLDGYPVEARGGGFRYLASKWMRRNRTWVAMSTIVLLNLVVGIGASLHQAQIAERERQRAESRFNEVRHLANDFLFEFHDAIATLPGSTAARQLVVNTALEYLEQLAAESAADQELLFELGAAFSRVGDVQGQSGKASLGDTAGAMASYRRAAQIFEQLASQQPSSQQQQALAAVRLRIGELLVLQSDLPGAASSYQQALEMRQSLQRADPEDRQARLELAAVYDRLGEMFRLGRDFDQALAHLQRAMAIHQQLAEETPDDPQIQDRLAASYSYVGDVHELLESPEMLTNYLQALEIDRRLAELEPQNLERQHGLISSLNRVSVAHRVENNLEAALTSVREALDIGQSLVAADPLDARARRTVSILHFGIANILSQQGDAAASFGHYESCLRLRRELAADDPSNVRAQREVATGWYWYATKQASFAAEAPAVQEQRRLLQGALRKYQRALAIFREQEERGVLLPTDKDSIAEVESKIARYQEALAGL